ncbi:hypothetical protein JVT61DRAFT_11934 [Boletus reticuloceps]|uniref:DUF6606 domain-containing protein n=1 Tax=Boletus reticuloceps TaxID=495285 RepID=A0A8I2YWS6_9AGAM|nr:hypothetical protein JVT61DRAFT_11934 [Boletus reticuloceps]
MIGMLVNAPFTPAAVSAKDMMRPEMNSGNLDATQDGGRRYNARTSLEVATKVPKRLPYRASAYRPAYPPLPLPLTTPVFKMTSSAVPFDASDSLRYAVTHVFLPIKPPAKRDYTLENDASLARAVCTAAHAYTEQAQWYRITKMLDNLQASVQSEHMDADHIISQLRNMQTGGTVAIFPIDPC